MESTHPLGFVLQHPVSSEVRADPERLVVRPVGWQTQRSPYELVIQRGQALPDTGYTTRQLGDRTVLHRESAEVAGSGGPLHELEGAIEVGGMIFHIRFHEQSASKKAPHAWIYWEVLRTIQPAP